MVRTAGLDGENGSSVRRGSYAVSGAEGAGDVSITAFPGDVGGNLANVNRWRGQLQLAPVSDLNGALQAFEANGLHMQIFEGSNQGTRMIGVIVPNPAPPGLQVHRTRRLGHARKARVSRFSQDGPSPMIHHALVS